MADGISHGRGASPGIISLRPFQLSDVDDVMEWMSDDVVADRTGWRAVATRDKAVQYMKSTIFSHPRYRAISLDGTPVGFISVTPRDGVRSCRAELSLSLARKYWGGGIATAAVKMESAAVFREWSHLARLDALVMDGNQRSSRVLEKAGFHRQAVHKRYRLDKRGSPVDVERYCLLRSHSKL